MRFIRLFGWLFAVIAICAVGYDLAKSLANGTLEMTPLGVAWHHISPSTLNALQAGIQRNVSPELWEDAIVPFLYVPGWLTFGIMSYIVLLLTRRFR